MDATSLGGALAGIVGVVGLVITLRRLPAQDTSDAVATQHTVFTDMKDLNDALIAELARKRERVLLLEERLETAEAKAAEGAHNALERSRLERDLKRCRKRCATLEAQLQQRGTGP